MSGDTPFTLAEARTFLAEKDLGFLDLCELLLALSEGIDGSIRWEHPRVVVHIKQKPRVKKVKPVSETSRKKV